MNNKLASDIITDMIEMALRPQIVSGAVYHEHQMCLNVNIESLIALAWARKKMQCDQSPIGAHICNVGTKHGFTCDFCLETELTDLNNQGIKTIGSCCGHCVKQGYIQVTPAFVDTMKTLGYEQIPVDKYGNGQWCFKPKSLFLEVPDNG